MKFNEGFKKIYITVFLYLISVNDTFFYEYKMKFEWCKKRKRFLFKITSSLLFLFHRFLLLFK